MLKLSEAAFQVQVERYAALMGWLIYHTRDSRGSHGGFPDLVLVRGPRVVWAELKAEDGELKPKQRQWLEALLAAGQEAHVFRPSDWPAVQATLTR